MLGNRVALCKTIYAKIHAEIGEGSRAVPSVLFCALVTLVTMRWENYSIRRGVGPYSLQAV
jgi:hypothetical protein